jgi:hypothetical protein
MLLSPYHQLTNSVQSTEGARPLQNYTYCVYHHRKSSRKDFLSIFARSMIQCCGQYYQIIESFGYSEVSSLIRLVLRLDNSLNYSVCDSVFAPQQGLVKGDLWSSLLFTFYINRHILSFNQRYFNPPTYKLS